MVGVYSGLRRGLTFVAVVVVDLGYEVLQVAGLLAGPGRAGGAPRLVQHHVALTIHYRQYLRAARRCHVCSRRLRCAD